MAESQTPVNATPTTVSSVSRNLTITAPTAPQEPVKTAPLDTILFNDEAVSIEIMADLIFEDIGGQELINIARNDTVNGQPVIYQPIKNLTSINQEYNPNNILPIQSTSDKYFQNFPIKFGPKIPTDPTGPNGEHVYINPSNGNLIIEAVNVDFDEQIEVEIATGGTIYREQL